MKLFLFLYGILIRHYTVQPIPSMIEEEYTGKSGVRYIFQYTECDTFDMLPVELCKQAHSVCFVGKQIAIVHDQIKNTWGLPGGTLKKNESPEQALIRETIEEVNVQIDICRPLGFQKVIDSRDNSYIYQLRYVSRGTKLGDFAFDPAGSVDKVLSIDPKDYKEYFIWGKIGESIFQKAGVLQKTLL